MDQNNSPPTGGQPASTGASGNTGGTAATGGSGVPGHTGETGVTIESVTERAEAAAGTAATLAKKYAPPAIGVIVIMIVAWICANWGRRATRAALTRTHFDPTLGNFVSNIVRWLILTLAVITCLNLFGIEQTSFAAVLGATGLAVGLALQGSLSNLAAGVMLLIFRPFKVGDSIVAAGQSGRVNEIDLFQTTLDTADGRRIFVPNGPIFANTIENTSFHPRRRVDVPLTVGLGAGIDQSRAALERAVGQVQGVLRDPPPGIVPIGFPVAGVDWMVSVWALGDNVGDVRAALVKAIKDELDKAEIPLKK
jgi:small conductance mechanosensitive channel